MNAYVFIYIFPSYSVLACEQRKWWIFGIENLLQYSFTHGWPRNFEQPRTNMCNQMAHLESSDSDAASDSRHIESMMYVYNFRVSSYPCTCSACFYLVNVLPRYHLMNCYVHYYQHPMVQKSLKKHENKEKWHA